MEALLAAQIVVIFASEAYFQRLYCLWELDAALWPFRALNLEAAAAEKEAALGPLLIVLPNQKMRELPSLPPALQQVNWPTAENLPEVERMVRTRLVASRQTLRERLENAGVPGVHMQARLWAEFVLQPPPKNLSGLRKYPTALPLSRAEAFVGRVDDLWRIHYALSMSQDKRGEGATGAAPIALVHGAGGFGKTRLALEYVHRFGPRYYTGGVFWIHADVDHDRLEEQFHGILRALDPDAKDLAAFREERKSVSVAMVEALDAVTRTQRVLFVVDNIPERKPGEEPKPLKTWCPVIGRASLLMTSREERVEPSAGVIQGIPLSTLTPEAAVDLLTRGLKNAAHLEDREWFEVAEWVGHLPLALDLLNTTMALHSLRPKSLLQRARKQRPSRELDDMANTIRSHLPESDKLRGVTETFFISYGSLSGNERRAARLMAQLSPAPIPQALLQSIEPQVMEDEQRTLLSRHFVEVTTREDVFGSMHKLLADYLRDQAAHPLLDVRQVCRGLIRLLRASVDSLDRHLLDMCLPHAEAAFDRMLSLKQQPIQLPWTERLKEWLGRREITHEDIELGTALGEALSARGFLQKAHDHERRVVEYAKASLGREHAETLRTMTNFASTLKALGKLEEAEQLQFEVWQASDRIYGSDHPLTLKARSALLVTQFERGQTGSVKAQTLLLERMRSALEDGKPNMDTLVAMSDLAWMYREQGKFEDAKALQQEVLDTLRQEAKEKRRWVSENLRDAEELQRQGQLKRAKALEDYALSESRWLDGEYRLRELTAMSYLAGTLQEEANLDQALVVEREVLDARSQLQGPQHPDTLTAMGNLAETLRARWMLKEARELQEEVLKVRQKELGADHPDTLTAMGNLAETHRTQRLHKEAKELQKQVLQGRRQKLGKEHLHTLLAMGHLAETHRELGELQEARELQEEELEIRLRVLEKDDRRTLKAIANLAVTLRSQGEEGTAQELETRALQPMIRGLGIEHPDTLAVTSHFAEALSAQGHPEAAKSIFEQVMELRKRRLGERHPLTLATMLALASACYRSSDYPRGKTLAEFVWNVRREELGEESDGTTQAMQLLAYLCFQLKEFAQARELLEALLKISNQRWVSKENSEALSIMSGLMKVYRELGELEKSREFGERLVDARRRLSGETHKSTLGAMITLIRTLYALKSWERAVELGEHVLEAMCKHPGETSPETLYHISWMVAIFHRQGDLKKAREMEDRIIDIMPRTQWGFDALDPIFQFSSVIVCAEMLEGQSERVYAHWNNVLQRLLQEKYPEYLKELQRAREENPKLFQDIRAMMDVSTISGDDSPSGFNRAKILKHLSGAEVNSGASSGEGLSPFYLAVGFDGLKLRAEPESLEPATSTRSDGDVPQKDE